MGGKKLANWAQATGNGQKWHLRHEQLIQSQDSVGMRVAWMGNAGFGGREPLLHIVVIISVDLIDTHIEQRRVNQFRDWENKVGGWCKSGEDTKLATLPGVNMQVGLAITCHSGQEIQTVKEIEHRWLRGKGAGVSILRYFRRNLLRKNSYF